MVHLCRNCVSIYGECQWWFVKRIKIKLSKIKGKRKERTVSLRLVQFACFQAIKLSRFYPLLLMQWWRSMNIILKWNGMKLVNYSKISNRTTIGDVCLGILGSRVTNTHDQQLLFFISMFLSMTLWHMAHDTRQMINCTWHLKHRPSHTEY